MRSVVFRVALLVATTAAPLSVAHAGGNAGALAYLSWNATSQVTDTACAAQNNLYVRLVRSSGIQFRGAEIDLTWDPAGDGGGCMDHIGTAYKTSVGTTCTYLNRGSAVPVVVADDTNHFHVAWANTSSLTTCTAGAIIQIQFETDACNPCGGCFSLNAASVLDLQSIIDYLPIAGPVVTVGGGGGHNCQPATAAEPSTWGHVKSLYRP